MATNSDKGATATPPATPAARFVVGCLGNLSWLVPLVWIGWPVARTTPPTLVCYCVVTVFGSALVAALADPISLRNRRGEDRATEVIVGLFSLAALILAATDFGRLQWTDCVPFALQRGALVLLTGAYALRIWAVTTNSFFAGLLVVQQERGHRVIDTGPYALVRHPGNLSILLIMICAPLALDSYLALAPMAVAVWAMFRRTRLEEAFVHEHLPGYAEYAGRVRYRMIPGVY